MEALDRARGRRARHAADAGRPAPGREGHGRDHLARGGAARAQIDFPRHGRLDRAVRRPVRHGVGHHDQLPGDRREQEHLPRGGRAGHCRGAVRHRARPARGDSCRHLLQQIQQRCRAPRGRVSKVSPTSSRAILSRQLDEPREARTWA